MYKKIKSLIIILFSSLLHAQPGHYITLENVDQKNIIIYPEDSGRIINGREELNLDYKDPIYLTSFKEELQEATELSGKPQSTIFVARVTLPGHNIQHRFYSALGLLSALDRQKTLVDLVSLLPISHVTIFRLDQNKVIDSLSEAVGENLSDNLYSFIGESRPSLPPQLTYTLDRVGDYVHDEDDEIDIWSFIRLALRLRR